ncbi:MAG: ClbS/DfsB family four-helix bundle protein [Chloroflexi bacterium]|nr:ClbS/DfsB family four-helix bundle protein [Chloroflexota bacterium]
MALKKPKTKEQFFKCEQATWEELNSLVAGLSKSALTQHIAKNDWSVKDVWAHLADWMIETRRVLPLVLEGKKVSAHIQAFNEEHYQKNQALSLETARRRLERERKRMLAYIQSIPEERLLGERDVYVWTAYATFNHYDQHLPALTKFRRATLRRTKRTR